MSETNKIISLRPQSPSVPDESARLAVTLTIAELKELISEVVRGTSNHSDNADLMDVDEAAKFLHQSKTYVYRNWREMGGRKLGKNLRLTRADLQKWIDSKGV